MGVLRGLLVLALWCAIAGVVPAAEVQSGLKAAQLHKKLRQLKAFRLKGASSGSSTAFPLRGRSTLSLPVCEWDATITDTTTAKCDLSLAYAIVSLRGVNGPFKDLLVCTAAKDRSSCKAAPNNCFWVDGSSEDVSCNSREFYRTFLQCLPTDDISYASIGLKSILCESFSDSQAGCTSATSPTCSWDATADPQCRYELTQEEQAALQGEEGGASTESASPPTDSAEFAIPTACGSDVGCSIKQFGVKTASASSTNPICRMFSEEEVMTCDATDATTCEAIMSSDNMQMCMWNSVYNTCSEKGAYLMQFFFPNNTAAAKALGDQLDVCQRKATQSDCAGATVPVTDKVKVVRAKVTFASADYDNITKSSEARAAFEADFKEAIASSAGVVDEWVVINGLSKGSVIADFKVIFPPDFDVQSTSFSNQLTTNTSAIFVNTNLQSYNPQPAQGVSSTASVSATDAEKSSARISAAKGSVAVAAVAALAAILLA